MTPFTSTSAVSIAYMVAIDVAKTIKMAIDYLTMTEDFKYAREVIS